jgi:hypothetical protein
LEITMHAQTNIAQTAQSTHTTRQAKQQQSLPTPPKPIKTAIRLILAGAVFLVIGITAWNKLRAEFDETFKRFSFCHSAVSERAS